MSTGTEWSWVLQSWAVGSLHSHVQCLCTGVCSQGLGPLMDRGMSRGTDGLRRSYNSLSAGGGSVSLVPTHLVAWPMASWASLVAQMVKNLSAMQETQAQFLGLEDLATHSSILA